MDDVCQMDYQYSPLAQQQLRLLRPIRSRDYDDLHFEIKHVSRKSSRRYTALSYTWGNQEPTKTIRLNGRLFHVRPNLLSCLYYLARARRREWDWIWVDAICINQQDDREKSEQVALMSRTYSDAQVVSVWLGLAPISPYLQDLLPNQEEFDNGNIITFEDDSFFWDDHLDNLLNRPYWSRFWVIQEFLRAREIHYYCSDNMTTSDRLYEKFTIMSGTTYGTSAALDQDFNNTLDSKAQKYKAASLILARNVDMFPELGSSLHDLLLRHRHAQCKDRRDRVFALLNLIGAEEHKLLSRFLPNYALSSDQVALIALAHVINYGGSFDHAEITVNSDKVFEALGLEGGRAVRKRMLDRAREFGYYDDWTSVDIARTMEVQEASRMPYDTFNDDAHHFAALLGPTSLGLEEGSQQRRPVFKSLGLLTLLGFAGALVFRYSRPSQG